MAYAAANHAAGSLRSNRRRFYNYYSSSQDRERHHTIDMDAQQPPRLRSTDLSVRTEKADRARALPIQLLLNAVSFFARQDAF